METPSGPKILIIDDDPFITDLYLLKLKEQGFLVESAANGKIGLEKIKTYGPDLVLLDIVMPALDGFDLLHKLKEQESLHKPKVVLLTNLGQKEEVERGMKLGAVDYIIKANFTPTEVVEKIKNILAK